MGIKRSLFYLCGLTLAVGGPVGLFSASDLTAGLRKSWSSGAPAANAPASSQPSPSPQPAPSPPALDIAGAGAPAVERTPTPRLDDVLRFDLTVEWVLRQWPRVSTGLPYLQLQGYRVPLVTGGNLADVAGSLTYYFNARQQVERITLRGTTGDPSVLVNLVASRHRFTRRLTNDPSLVLYEAVDSSNRPVGTLKIRSAQVVKASQPYTRFELDLTMDRPE